VGRVPFIAVYSRYVENGYMIYVIGRGGEVVGRVRHHPWFVSSVKVKGPNVARVEELPGRMLAFDEQAGMYAPLETPVFKVECFEKKQVPAVAREVIGWHGRAGLFNVTYEVRAAFDIQRGLQKGGEKYGILGYPTPLAFLPNSEMIELMRKVIDDAAELKVMAVDIEVYSARGGFPVKGDPVLSITYSTFKLGEDIFSEGWVKRNVKYLLNEGADAKGSRELVAAFADVVSREKPDIIVGYNSSGFDFPYMRPFASRHFAFRPDFVVDKAGGRFYPHVDLMVVRDMMGPSLGLRSHTVYALDDVAVEAIKGNSVDKFNDVGWLFNSRYLEAERKLDHAKLKEHFDRRDEIFFDYIVADVYLTSLLARVWLYPLLLLSVLTGIPITVLQKLNVGQMAEYVISEFLVRLGFYPELRFRSKGYSRVSQVAGGPEARRKLEELVPDWWVFERGKVYVTSPGLYGGGDRYIVELDFAQLYPTDMVYNTSDPTSIFTLKAFEYSGGDIKPARGTLAPGDLEGLKVAELRTWALLKSGGREGERLELYEVVPGYGPVAWFLYKMYTARAETKKMKAEARAQGRVELLAPDQAIKIYNNSIYGAFSKERGNLVHELLSATVFWRTQRLLYRVIEAVETEVSRELGAELKVLYGDTDSTYILAPKSVPPEEIEGKVNEWIRRHYGPLYRMELEDAYERMLIPRRKNADDPSAKSYILLDEGGRIKKIRGEFFKLPAPLAIKDRLNEFFEGMLSRGIASVKELEEYIRDFMRGEPAYKFFIKKSVQSFVSEDDPSRFKNLNKAFHYAALVLLCESGAPGAKVLERREVVGVGGLAGGESIKVKCEVDPRVVEDTQRAVVVLYLPHTLSDSKKFALFAGEDGDSVVVDEVSVTKVSIKSDEETERSRFDKAIVVEYTITRRRILRDAFPSYVLSRIKREVVSTLYRKLVLPARGGG